MAKLTSNGVTIEGTPEELVVIMERFTVEANVVESVEVEEAEPLKVGDYARVISTADGGVTEVGDIVELVGTWDDDFFYYKPLLGGERTGMWAYRFEKATDEEVSAFRVKAEAGAIFTANGRKVNELREGDLIRVIDRCGAGGGISNGDILEVSEKSTTVHALVPNDWVVSAEIVTFVENRLDRK